MTYEALRQEAMLLPKEKRNELAEELFQSLGDPEHELTPEQREELQGRLAKVRSGQATGVPWEEFRKELLKGS
jgi:putative addiction module component (TIGR02574 family)